MNSRRESEEVQIPANQLDEIFPSFLFNDMQDQLDENLEKLEVLYKENAKDEKYGLCFDQFMQELITRLYNAIYRCHNPQVVKFFRTFCKYNDIILPETRICKWYNNNDIPCLIEVGEAIQANRNFKFQFMPPLPVELNQVLNNIHLPDRCIPNLQRLLLLFPSYLEKYFQLQDTLLQQSNILDQPVGYFLAICSAAELGCIYTMKRFIKRFLQIGGSRDWLKGSIPNKIKKVLPLGHQLAYCPYEIGKEDLAPLLIGGDCWSVHQLLQAASIMCFAQLASSFALTNGINPEDASEIPNVDLKDLQSFIHWEQRQSIYERFRHPLLKPQSQKIQKPQSPNLTLQNKPSTKEELHQDYTKQINNEMKSNVIYDKLYETFKYYLPPYKKVTRRNQQLVPAIDHSQYNFKFYSYLYIKEFNNDIAEGLLNLIDYCKDMTLGKVGNKETSTVGYRKAIRYYCENLAGYTHQDFNYKANMNDFLSKELKFFVKLISYQPFLMRKEATLKIPHQNMELSLFDVIHVSLLVLTTKLEYSLMFLCRILQYQIS